MGRAERTRALEAVTDPSWSTVALEATGCVGAGGVSVTVMGADLTLVNVC